MHPIKFAFDQLLKEFEKAPGWIPLYILTLIVAELIHLPEKVHFAGRNLPLSVEIVAGAITLLMYLLGDALDNVIFKSLVTKDGKKKIATRPFFKKQYEKKLSTAADKLETDTSGMYALSLKLAAAAEKERKTLFIHLPNEGAKFLRSLIVPSAIAALYEFICAHYLMAAGFLVLCSASLMIYPELKVVHLRKLYSWVGDITADGEKYLRRPVAGIPLFFWDGKFVLAGLPPSKQIQEASAATARVGVESSTIENL
jgi:hypothetical protein